MLVPLLFPDIALAPAPNLNLNLSLATLRSIMAPVASPIDVRAQTVENCRFFTVSHAALTLVTAKEPLGTFKAIVVKTENGRREALLSESAPTIPQALQQLLVKSAEAVQNYIGTNGFAFAPGDDDNDDDESDFDGPSYRVNRRDTASTCESLSDNETVSVAPATSKAPSRGSRKSVVAAGTRHVEPMWATSDKGPSTTRRPRPRSRSSSRSRSRSRSASSSRASSRTGTGTRSPSREPAADRPANFRVYSHPGYGMQVRPPNVHRGWAAAAGPPAPPAPPQPYMRFPVPFHGSHPPPPPPPAVVRTAGSSPTPPSPPNNRLNTTPPLAPPLVASAPTKPIPAPLPASTTSPTTTTQTSPQAPRDIRLLITHPGGAQHILTQSPLSIRAIAQVATAYVRRNRPQQPQRPPLHACVRRVAVEKTWYDVSGFGGDDLSGLVGAGLALVEVEVVEGKTVMGRPSMTGMRPNVAVQGQDNGSGGGGGGGGGHVPGPQQHATGNGNGQARTSAVC
ncbi:hypothetical protein B0T25DRAFT_168094 [Lasiosphaeria hispida]|uniref:Uncharacterized protein n=1 Tax=Lasiosphaeria hispida TaxID=260671 RepID=A0AAJ0HNA7_9PEZI|nr:hypothetical protein B0T25DRAFT_168094 [Lasiosphaeria hispida]